MCLYCLFKVNIKASKVEFIPLKITEKQTRKLAIHSQYLFVPFWFHVVQLFHEYITNCFRYRIFQRLIYFVTDLVPKQTLIELSLLSSLFIVYYDFTLNYNMGLSYGIPSKFLR